MKKLVFVALLLGVIASSVPSWSITRTVRDNPFFRRTALTGYMGVGIPVGEFESSRDGDGNHKPGSFQWAIDIEHFFSPSVSLGASINASTWEDKDAGQSLETHVNAFNGFFRYVVITKGPIYPFLRFGAGWTRVQFQDFEQRFQSNSTGTIQAGGGTTVMLSHHVAFTGQALYHHGFTENALVPDANAIVGFDTKYWSVTAGLSLFFQ